MNSNERMIAEAELVLLLLEEVNIEWEDHLQGEWVSCRGLTYSLAGPAGEHTFH